MNQENIDTCIHCIHSEKENIFSLLEFPLSSSSLHIFPEEIMKKGLKTKVLNPHSPCRNATPNNGGNMKSLTEQLTFCLLRNRQFNIQCSVECRHFNTAECFNCDF